MEKNKTYLVKSIKKDKPLYMNYGLIENSIVKVIDKSSDNKTFFLEIVGFNRKIAISSEYLSNLVLEEINDQER